MVQIYIVLAFKNGTWNQTSFGLQNFQPSLNFPSKSFVVEGVTPPVEVNMLYVKNIHISYTYTTFSGF